ncbi:hypothetical protein EJ04DRAFT_507845 [Polyplosphaeria fusca]|uniref:Uncharacterized protein n=1 Tax=Polyplosphaeria fusca TaxID=682080 RepID=A0A9P4RCC9_9PLEO|nr:hypothetical protein EJ04DRAFT_507845 [Polyplosphaeria fusca]
MDSSRSRRSYPNLPKLSLAPLSAQYPLDASQPPSPAEPHPTTPHTSYIAQRSAPTTPGILSLSQSRSSSRTGRRCSRGHVDAYHDHGHFPNPDAPLRDIGDIPKAKSTSILHPPPGVTFADQSTHRKHRPKGTAPNSLRLPLARHHTSEANDEWFHRAGLAIAGETRESKGQGWLVRRESSSSLVGQLDSYEEHQSHGTRHMALLSGEHIADIEYSAFSPRVSKAPSRISSRIGSRVPSARNSRRGSRVGSKSDLLMSAGPRTPSARHSLEITDSMFEDDENIEPDFVNDDESDGDEQEVARLAAERGFGLGNWMDRLIGWTLFSVDEDGEESSDEEEAEDNGAQRPENMTREELKLRREVEAKRRRLERETIIAASAVKSQQPKDIKPDDSIEGPDKAQDGEGGAWQDAAWLFSVASKVIL